MTARSRWPLLGVLLTAHLSFVLVVWLAIAVVSTGIVVGVATFERVEESVWHHAATQAPRWIMLGLGGDLISTYLRLHVAHGRTRRDFLRQSAPYFVVTAAVFAALIAVGYLIERAAYGRAGWPHELAYEPLFGSSTQVAGIFGCFFVMLLLWVVAGAIVGAAFLRSGAFGFLSIPVGLVLVAPGELLLGGTGIPVLGRLVSDLEFPTPTSVGACLVSVAVAGLTLWGLTRDMPLAPRMA